MNKIYSLEILQALQNYFQENLNNIIDEYNLTNSTELQKINNITYNTVKMLLPELYIGIDQTNIEYEDITMNANKKIVNNCYLSLAFKSNNINFQDDIERYIYILSNMLENFNNEIIIILLIKSIKRGELQSRDMQTIKIINIDFDIISVI